MSWVKGLSVSILHDFLGLRIRDTCRLYNIGVYVANWHFGYLMMSCYLAFFWLVRRTLTFWVSIRTIIRRLKV